jgi:hypothetical protein
MNIEDNRVVANFAMDHSNEHIQRHFVDCPLIRSFCDYGLSKDDLVDAEGVCVAATTPPVDRRVGGASPFLISAEFEFEEDELL